MFNRLQPVATEWRSRNCSGRALLRPGRFLRVTPRVLGFLQEVIVEQLRTLWGLVVTPRQRGHFSSWCGYQTRRRTSRRRKSLIGTRCGWQEWAGSPRCYTMLWGTGRRWSQVSITVSNSDSSLMGIAVPCQTNISSQCNYPITKHLAPLWNWTLAYG